MKKKNFKENNSAFIKLWTASLCRLTSDFALLFFRRTSWLARVTCSIWWIPFLHSSCQVWRDRWRWGNSFSRIGKMSSSSLMVTGKSKLHVKSTIFIPLFVSFFRFAIKWSKILGAAFFGSLKCFNNLIQFCS